MTSAYSSLQSELKDRVTPRDRNSQNASNWETLVEQFAIRCLLIDSTNLFGPSDSRCLSGKKLDSEALDGAVVAFSLRTYKFLSSPPGAAFFGVLPMATRFCGVPAYRSRELLSSTPFFFIFFLSNLILCKQRNNPA